MGTCVWQTGQIKSSSKLFHFILRGAPNCLKINLKVAERKTINVNLTVTVEEMSGDNQSHYNSSSGEDGCLCKISWQSITQLLRYFNLKVVD